MTQRCEIHHLYMPSSGCKICKEINQLKTDYENRIIDKNLEIISLKKQLDNHHEKLKRDNDFLRAEIKSVQLKTKDMAVHRAATWLDRNNIDIVRNLWGAESIIASVWDLYFKIPNGQRKTELRPLIDKAIDIAAGLNDINSAIAEKIIRPLGEKAYSDLVVDTIRMLDTLGGKIKRCETCIDALERKKVIKAELTKELEQ